MKKLTVLCDMDSIIVALTPKWLKMYNQDHNDNVTLEDIKSWDMAHNVKIGTKIYDYLYTPGFFLDVEPVDGALGAIKWIHDNHNLVIASAPSWPGNSASDKITWLKKHVPWFNKRDLMLGHHKYLLKGDIFIDDSPENIQAYAKHWPGANIMTISYPYNQGVKNLIHTFAEDYTDTQKAWDTILEDIDYIAHNY